MVKISADLDCTCPIADDRKAREAAQRLGIPVTGPVGLLHKAKQAGSITAGLRFLMRWTAITSESAIHSARRHSGWQENELHLTHDETRSYENGCIRTSSLRGHQNLYAQQPLCRTLSLPLKNPTEQSFANLALQCIVGTSSVPARHRRRRLDRIRNRSPASCARRRN